MNVRPPHYVLFSGSDDRNEPGRWRFILRTLDGSKQIAADDVEPDVRGERLELLAAVRGLEALDQPSRVTLVTPSGYVRRGIRFGLKEWRRNGWRWEYFGQMVPVKNGDLWQRVDRAMRFHKLEFRSRRIDPPHEAPNVTCRSKSCVRPSATPSPPPVGRSATPSPPPVGRSGTASPRRSPAPSDLREGSEYHSGLRGRSDSQSDRQGESWHAGRGLSRLSNLVRLIRKNRPVGIRPAAVCREA